MTAFLTVSTASFAADCGAIDDTTRVDQESIVSSDGSTSGSGKVESAD